MQAVSRLLLTRRVCLQDECVYHEEDDSFYIGISRSRSERMLYIHAGRWQGPRAARLH